MSKKSKTSEINDIIDSSYVEANYSYSNEYYDEVDSHRPRNTCHNTGNGGNPFSKISSIRAPPSPISATPVTTSHANTSNIFMKYTGNTNTAGDNPVATPKEIKNTEDEFPSLGGGGRKKTNVLATPPLMNFKKIVETKKPIEVQQQVVQSKRDDYYNRFKVYEEVKYYSEKTARSKIYRSGYSDDEDVDDLDDMDDDE